MGSSWGDAIMAGILFGIVVTIVFGVVLPPDVLHDAEVGKTWYIAPDTYLIQRDYASEKVVTSDGLTQVHYYIFTIWSEYMVNLTVRFYDDEGNLLKEDHVVKDVYSKTFSWEVVVYNNISKIYVDGKELRLATEEEVQKLHDIYHDERRGALKLGFGVFILSTLFVKLLGDSTTQQEQSF